MASLSAKQEAFIKLMMENDELARRGFDLLLKRSDFDQFFDHLKEAGFFQPHRNPAPTPVDEKGFFRIPYWNALDYLIAVARLAGNKADAALGQKVIAVVRAVTNWVDDVGGRRDNYHTYRKFAEILGLVPISTLSDEDIQLIPIWLESKFDRGSVCHTLADSLIPKLLASESPADWRRVVTVLSHCTAVRWVDAKELGQAEKKPTMPVEDYWLDELVAKYAHQVGQKAGQSAADLFLNRTQEVFSAEVSRSYSHVYRPAIEEHSQNHSWRGPENICVKGLRDVLLGWCDTDADVVKQYVANLIASPDEIVRRIAISVIDQRWDSLRQVFLESLSPKLFDWGHLHELYTLLNGRFASLEQTEQAKTLDAIQGIPEPTWAEAPGRARRRMQRQWLSAIAGKNYQPADHRYAELNADKSIGALSEHPDFDSYMEVSWGPGTSPYSSQELQAFASAGSLIDRLNNFQPSGHWNGPTMRALTDALEEAVRQAPDVFVRLLSQFLSAKRPFQYAVLNGLKTTWDSKDAQAQLDWNDAWARIVDFFEKTLGDDTFWAEEVVRDADFSPTRDWIPPVVADFLRAGAKDDAHAYPEAFLPRALALIKILLERAPAVDEPSDDAMTQAINSSKGKAVEALMSHALRTCRVADKAEGSHTKAWEELRPVYDAELGKCKGANFEVSTLCGAYFANLLYMSRTWVEGNITRIFPTEHHANALCALDGLAYSRAQSSVYALLMNAGVIDWALKADLKGRYTLEKLVERVAVAYVRGEEPLDSPRFTYLFESAKERELELVARFLWSIRGEPLSTEQVDRVIAFWERCVEWSAGRPKPPAQLLSALASLAGFLKTADGRNLELLAAVAPFVHVDHGAYQFFEELTRLVPTNPAGTSLILGRFLDAHVPDFDYQDRLKSLVRLLAAHGQRQDAIKYTELARTVSGMQALFDELTKGH